jgi:Zn-dependent peptidase ImmA (M78 family)
VTAFPILPIAIAAARDIPVYPKDASEAGVSGMLLRSGNSFAIAYATHIRNEGFQRFSIAHELGHYFLDGHPEAIFAGGDTHTSRAGFASGAAVELEADHFAAALLMPRKLFKAAMDARRDGLDAVEGLAAVCGTSLLATAIRYAETTSAPVAVVVSRGRLVDYCFMSDAMRAFRGLTWPRKGSSVPRESSTYGLNAKPGAVASGDRDGDDTDFSIWFDGNQRMALYEEVVGLGEYGRSLTILSADASADDNDDEPEDDEWEELRFSRR